MPYRTTIVGVERSRDATTWPRDSFTVCESARPRSHYGKGGGHDHTYYQQ